MRTRKNPIIVILLSISLLCTQFSFVQNASAATSSKLYYSNQTLAGTTAITSDVTIGKVPDGVTINAGDSGITSPASAKISFTSDDGSTNDWDYRDVFASRGVSCTVPLVENYVTGRIGGVEVVSLTKIKSLQNEYGYEIGSHSYDHVKLTDFVNPDDALFQMSESKRSLTSLGLKISNFYVPFGSYNQTILNQASSIYRAVRTSDWGVNTPLNKRNMKVYWLDAPMSLEHAKQYVDTARAARQFIIFGFHGGGASRNFMDDTVGALIDYIQSFNDAQVLTVDKSLDRVENVMREDADFKLVDNKIVLDKFFVRSLPIGKNTLTFSFSDGTVESTNITIEKNNGPRHDISVTATSLAPGHNNLDSNQTITFQATVDTNLAGERYSYATIGNATANGVLAENIYTYTFNTNDINDNSYNSLSIHSFVGSDEALHNEPIDLSIEKISTQKNVLSINTTILPVKTKYLEGDSFTANGMIVMAFYDDETSAIVTGYQLSGYDSAPGQKIITVTYKGQIAQFSVAVVARQLTSIAITSQPLKKTYLQDETLDLSGLVLTAYYNNNSSSVISNYSVTGDTSLAGSITITLTYASLTAELYITVTAKTYTSIEITTLPRKLNYFAGEPLSVSGLVVTGHLTDGTNSIVAKYTVSGYNPNILGEQTVTITKESVSATFKVFVTAVEITRIEVTTNPVITRYLEGDTFDPAGLIVTAYYNNSESIDITSYILSGYTSTPGVKTITVTYLTFNTEFTVSVLAKKLSSIDITKLPDKLIYFVGDEVKLSGLELTAYYNNGTSAIINNYLVSWDTTKTGTINVYITFGDLTDSYEIAVQEKAYSRIEITSKPRKLSYLKGENLSLSGMVVTAFNFDSSSFITHDYTVSGYDPNTLGEQTITVTLKNCSETFKVTINEPVERQLSFIEITSNPTKTRYLEGDLFDASGLVVTSYYNDSSDEVITDYSITGYNSTPGVKTITVSYQGLEAQFTVSVLARRLTSIDITKLPDKLTYYEGFEIDLSGIEVTAYYNNGTSAVIGNYMVGDYLTTPGNNEITIMFGDMKDVFNVTVIQKSVTSISIKSQPRKLTYFKGESILTSGLEITANYNDATSKTIWTGYDISGFDPDIIGEQTITVSFSGKSATFKVNVVAIKLTSIEVIGNPTKTRYLEGEVLNSSGLVIEAYYNDGSSQIVTDYTLSGYNSSPGVKAVTVTYQGKKTEFYVNITAKVLKSITLSKKPDKINYIEGELFDIKGMKLTAHFVDGSSSNVTEYSFSGYTQTPGKKTIRVSYRSKSVTFTVTVSAQSNPAAPYSVKAVSNSYNSIKISWKLISNATGYLIYRSDSADGTYKLVSTVNANSYINIKLATNKTYFYKVKSFRTASGRRIYGKTSVIVSAKPVPATPGALNTVKYNTTSVKLSWAKVDGASGYEVFRSTSQNGTYTLESTVSLTTYMSRNLTKGMKYYYKVRSYKIIDGVKVYSNYSTIKFATPG